MKKPALLFLLLITGNLLLFAQTPGTVNTTFGDNGQLRIYDGNDDYIWLSYLETKIDTSDSMERLVLYMAGNVDVGGDYRKPELYVSKYTSSDLSLKSVRWYKDEWQGKLSGKMNRLSEGIIAPDNSLFFVGANDNRGSVVKMTSPGVLDDGFGQSGVVFTGSASNEQWLGSIDYYGTEMDDLQIYVGGQSVTTNTRGNIWKMDGYGNPIEGFGNAGSYRFDHEVDLSCVSHFSCIEDNTKIMGVGFTDRQGWFFEYDMVEDQVRNRYFPETISTELNYDASCYQNVNGNLFIGGDYHTNNYVEFHGWLKKFNQDGSLDETFLSNITETISGIEESTGGVISGISHIEYVPPTITKRGSINAVERLVIAGTIQKMGINAAFIMSVFLDGILDTAFGQLGFNLWNFDSCARPSRLKIMRNGMMMLAVNTSGMAIITFLYGYRADVSGVEKNVALEDSYVYPNPFTKLLYLKAKRDYQAGAKIKIFNQQGALIKAKSYDQGIQRDQNILIDDFSGSPGIYHLILTDGKKQEAFKLVKTGSL